MEREPDPLTAGVAQDQEAGLSSTGMVSIRRDVLDGTLKGGEGDGGISCGHFLIRPVFDTGAHELLPIARPVAEEFAIAVIDQQRTCKGLPLSILGTHRLLLLRTTVRSHGHRRTAPVLWIGLCSWTHIGNRDAILSGKTRRTILQAFGT